MKDIYKDISYEELAEKFGDWRVVHHTKTAEGEITRLTVMNPDTRQVVHINKKLGKL